MRSIVGALGVAVVLAIAAPVGAQAAHSHYRHPMPMYHHPMHHHHMHPMMPYHPHRPHHPSY